MGTIRKDILKLLYNREITKEEAYDIIDNIIQISNDYYEKYNIKEFDLAWYIGFNQYEYTAYCHGVDLSTLVKWRYEGWPTKCYLCKKEIDYKQYNWTVIKSGKELIHVECPVLGLAKLFVRKKG